MLNCCHARGDGDVGEAAATRESIVSNARHALGDNGSGASCNKGITVRFYNGIAPTTRVIDCVFLSYSNGGKAAAIRESPVSNTRHAFGYVDGGEAPATIESIVSNARHALGDGDGGEAAAIIESSLSNARHTILHTPTHGGGNGDRTRVFSIPVCHLQSQVRGGGNIVVDTIHLKVVGAYRKAA